MDCPFPFTRKGNCSSCTPFQYPPPFFCYFKFIQSELKKQAEYRMKVMANPLFMRLFWKTTPPRM